VFPFGTPRTECATQNTTLRIDTKNTHTLQYTHRHTNTPIVVVSNTPKIRGCIIQTWFHYHTRRRNMCPMRRTRSRDPFKHQRPDHAPGLAKTRPSLYALDISSPCVRVSRTRFWIGRFIQNISGNTGDRRRGRDRRPSLSLRPTESRVRQPPKQNPCAGRPAGGGVCVSM
jgi:hypothetical protein